MLLNIFQLPLWTTLLMTLQAYVCLRSLDHSFAEWLMIECLYRGKKAFVGPNP